MKKHFYLLSAMALSASNLLAQPVIDNMENYVLGMNTKILNCSTAGVDTGSNGNQTWDMTGLVTAHPSTPQFDTVWHYVVPNSLTTSFPTANLVDSSNEQGTTRLFLNQSSSQTNLLGIVVNNGVVTSTQTFDATGVLLAQQPIHYNDQFSSSFSAVSVNSNVVYNSGTYSALVDGWGTLKLPSGTFDNVLRVKVVQSETDSGTGVSHTVITEYDWYDNHHSKPLLKIKSSLTQGASSPAVTVQYLVSQTPLVDVKSVANNTTELKGCFNNNELVLNSSFKQGSHYQVSLMNIAGQVVFKNEFVSGGDKSVHLYPENLIPGMYLVTMTEANKPGISSLKVVKQ